MKGELRKEQGYEYARSSNPTRNELESLLISLETAPSSHASDGDNAGAAVVFSSGSAGTAAAVHWASLGVEEGGAGGRDGKGHGGGHILAVNDVYGGTARMLSRTCKPLGVETTFLSFEQAGEQGIREALRPDTRVRFCIHEWYSKNNRLDRVARVPDQPTSPCPTHTPDYQDHQ